MKMKFGLSGLLLAGLLAGCLDEKETVAPAKKPGPETALVTAPAIVEEPHVVEASPVAEEVANDYSRHPRIFGTEETRGALTEKIENIGWAASVFKGIQESVEKYVDQHVSDPEWIVSRLQMHWKTKYAKTYVNGSHWSHGEGEAPVPTVRFAGERDWNTDYIRPKLEDIQPYVEDERGMWLQNGKKDGKPWEWAPYRDTGHTVESINAHILSLAEKSAFLYWYTGEEKYAKFAADIAWTYIEGMYHRSNPITFEDHSKAGIIGLATFEVIHEGISQSVAVSYDYLHDYLNEQGKDLKLAQDLLRRWSDRIIEGGGAEGNWNINQARNFVYMALALEGDDQYEDGKGQQYYIRQFTSESSKNQMGLHEVVPQAYDPDDGVWPEAPGYAFSVTDTILQLAQVIHNGSGQDVLEMVPIIVPAATVASQFLFPNGYMVGFGDTYHQKPYMDSLELLLARFQRLEDEEAAKQIVPLIENQMKLNGYRRDRNRSLLALTSFVDKLPEGKSEKPLQTRTFYTDSVSYLAQRNSKDAENGLMISLAGSRGGHMQANGMAMELYGKGMVLGPDSGRGPSYWTTSHGEYYMRFAAHNTVSVDGISDYSHKKKIAYDILSMEPAAGSYDALSENYSFTETEFVEPKTDALQRRTLGIVRASDTVGYYVDIFRSKRKDGNDKKHEYIYHNVGQELQLAGKDGKPLILKPTEELGTESGDHKGYNYFAEKFSTDWNADFYAQFNVSLKKGKDTCMRMWMKGEQDRQVFSVKSPVSRAVCKGSVPRELWDLPLPTLIVRQEGEAWTKPFVAVYEPFYKDDGSALKKVQALEPRAPAGDFVGIAVQTKADGIQYIFNNTDDAVKASVMDMIFIGTYGAISVTEQGLKSFYLGRGRALIKDGMGIDGQGQVVSASLEKTSRGWIYSADKEVLLRVDGKKVKLPAAHNAVVEF
ncbi:hypothetical protein P4B35_15555 [Pontiellaceae bacterium B12227]|nr:hypothetical protein [Pontiellaceae bacterium B12227]